MLRIDQEAGNWKLVIEATKFVTNVLVNVWTGIKPAATTQPVNNPPDRLRPTVTLAAELP